jgi:hypothetical protein
MAKMRWFLGTMMYVTCIISTEDIDKILLLLQPTTPNVVDIEAEKNNVLRALSELQSDICHTHEKVARAWLSGPFGQVFQTSQEQATR